MMLARFAFSLAILCAAPAMASADPLVDEGRESRATIVMQDGMIETHIVNRSYDMTSLADDRSGEPKLVRYLVSVEIDRRIRDGQDLETEFLSSTARVAARPIGEQGLAAATLDIETPGDEVAVSGPFLIVTRWGCCALQSSHAAYSLLSGARLFSATGEGEHGDWVTMGSRHRPDEARYVAAHVAPTLSDAEELGEDETHVIAITYAAGAGARQRLIVTLQSGRNSDEVLNWLPKLTWVTSDQPGGTDHVFVASDAPAEETYTGFHLRLQLDDATRIDIPLEKDRLAWDRAVLPTGFGLIEATN